MIWCLQLLWHLLLLLVPLEGLRRLPGAHAQSLGDMPAANACPAVEIVPDEGSQSYIWDIVIALAFIIFAAACYGGGWLHGWWIGRNYILRRRHVRSDRLQDQLNLRMREILDLQGKWNSCSNRSKNLLCLLAQSSPTERSRSSNRKCETWSRASGTRTGSCEPWIESA